MQRPRRPGRPGWNLAIGAGTGSRAALAAGAGFVRLGSVEWAVLRVPWCWSPSDSRGRPPSIRAGVAARQRRSACESPPGRERWRPSPSSRNPERRPYMDIPRMASWHGHVNGLGFARCGLLGWAADTRTLVTLPVRRPADAGPRPTIPA